MSTIALLSLLARGDAENGALDPRTTTSSPLDINPLPTTIRKGLIAVTVMAFCSFVATATLISFITYRLVFWRANYKRYIGYNQYIVLIYNLVLADFQQSLAFLLCLRWILTNKIKSGTATCFLQGMWLQVGDPGSGLFVLAIACHTFVLVVLGRKISHKVFASFVIGIWVFVAIIVAIPLSIHGVGVFIPSGAWCWINEDYENIRLGTHYLWIFIAQFGTVCLYAVMYFQLRRQIANSSILGNSQLESLKRLRRVVGYMTIYPVVYIVLSLPLAAGRMATASGLTPSITYFCCAGAIITSSGLVDVILYTLTRRNLIVNSEPSNDRSYNKFPSSKGRTRDATTTITAGPTKSSRHQGMDEDSDDLDRDGSTDNIVQRGVEMAPMDKGVYQHTTIEVTSEPAFPSETESERSSRDFPDPPNRAWRR